MSANRDAEDGISTPITSQEEIEKNCPSDCPGCSCHIFPPCTHCLEHLNAKEDKVQEAFKPSVYPLTLKEAFVHEMERKKIKYSGAAADRKAQGLCPICGEKGYFSHLVLICPTHGEY